MKMGGRLILVALLATIAVGPVNRVQAAPEKEAAPVRERLLLDFGWKFHLGDDWGTGEKFDKAGVSTGPARSSFPDKTWRTLNLPHDWAVELPFDSRADRSHGYKPLGPGYATNNVGWYRRKFTLSNEDRGKRLWLEFDGVFRDARVFLNGYRLGRRESGYTSFRYDITDIANCGGENTLAVRVDVSQFEGWFYEGAGIYRHVWLVKTAPLAVAPNGTFVSSRFKDNIPKGAAEVQIETRLSNAQEQAATVRVRCVILDAVGKAVGVAEKIVTLKPWTEAEVKQSANVAAPKLWSPEMPQLHRLITTLESAGEIVDRTETEFGIRTVAFDPNKGFLLNGAPYVIKGTCNHQDHAGVGIAIPDALQYFRVAKLKEMGANALRTSHNPPTPELLEACDRLGMLVMNECRIVGSDPQNLADLSDLLVRDRNHPSVFMWSLANEEMVQRDESAARAFATMQRLVHRLDPTRACTAAMNSWSTGKPDGFSTVADVQGFNYMNNGDIDGFHRANSKMPCIGTEEASTFYTRGIYTNTSVYQSAYDDNKPSYGATAEEWWKIFAARPWTSGAFVWTGFDYRGEPSPFHWPNISSQFGILDTCGFPKDAFYYYQSWWSDKTVLHLMPHWNWNGRESEPIDVRCFSNCDQVELFLNGQSLGRKSMPRNSHLRWSVNYTPGALAARGFKGGKLIAETAVETTGAPAALKLVPDRAQLRAGGEDVSVIAVAVVDAQGRTVPAASNFVSFELSGPGKILGVGNGDPICHESDVFVSTPRWRIRPVDDWRMSKVPEAEARPEVNEEFSDAGWDSVDIRVEHGPLKEKENAVFRTRAKLSEADLTAANVMLAFGRIDDHGWIYVNGQLVGESHNWREDPAFDVRKALKPGENTIAVLLKNDDSQGGVNLGATLEFQEAPVATGWTRSAFNGLAQIIVQGDRQAGEIQLTASADGLAPALLKIRTETHRDRATPRLSDFNQSTSNQ